MLQSMSRKGNCRANALAESFFKKLKIELTNDNSYKIISKAKAAIFEYVEIWYNRRRLHFSLRYKTPLSSRIRGCLNK